jgi:hypothetical protein
MILLKIPAFLLNIGLLLTVLFTFATKGFTTDSQEVAIIVAFGLVLPVINMIVIIFSAPKNPDEKSLFALYFKRRKLEEMRKIAEAQKGIDAAKESIKEVKIIK